VCVYVCILKRSKYSTWRSTIDHQKWSLWSWWANYQLLLLNDVDELSSVEFKDFCSASEACAINHFFAACSRRCVDPPLRTYRPHTHTHTLMLGPRRSVGCLYIYVHMGVSNST